VLPNLIVIGASKCGTTSLHKYLDLHPEISMTSPKELNFFVTDLNWSRGIRWYEQHFREPTPVRGESSTAYTEYPERPEVPERIAGLVPDVKLIYCVRDPIERMVSSYAFNTWLGFRLPPFPEAVRDFEHSSLVARSRYWLQLERYLDHFSAEQIHVVDQDRLLHDREATLGGVFRFLGVDETFRSPRFREFHHPTPVIRNRLAGASTRFLQVHLGRARERRIRWALWRILCLVPLHETVVRPVVGDDLRAELAAGFADDVARLRAFTGQPFAGWSM
jgi:sulfotransferase family protein